MNILLNFISSKIDRGNLSLSVICLILADEQRQITIGIGGHRARLTLGPGNFVCPGRTRIEEMVLIRLDQGSFIPEMLLRPDPECKIHRRALCRPDWWLHQAWSRSRPVLESRRPFHFNSPLSLCLDSLSFGPLQRVAMNQRAIVATRY